jgi:hypothetical protein
MLLFREGAWVHEYWPFYLATPLVLWYWNSDRIYALFNNTNAGPQGVYSLFNMW